jgi:hypothetical protein
VSRTTIASMTLTSLMTRCPGLTRLPAPVGLASVSHTETMVVMPTASTHHCVTVSICSMSEVRCRRRDHADAASPPARGGGHH